MTPRQAAFFRQAESDWAVYMHLATLGAVPACHQLHYLQMCCEKLAKAYFANPGSRSHAGFRKYCDDVKGNPKAVTPLGFLNMGALQAWYLSAVAVIGAVEDLAPAIADRLGMPNPEYPWPRGAETTAPADYPFQAEFYSHLAAQFRSGEPPFVTILDRMVRTMQSAGWHE